MEDPEGELLAPKLAPGCDADASRAWTRHARSSISDLDALKGGEQVRLVVDGL